MRSIYFILFAFCFGFSLNAQIVNIPDANFKAKLLSANSSTNLIASTQGVDVNGNVTSFNTIDTNSDGEIQVSEAAEIKYLDVSFYGITSLDGIMSFINLQSLRCVDNQLPSLSVSGLTNLQVLNCGDNQLTSLNVSGLTNLQSLNCPTNQLLSLNVSGLTNLQYLSCSYNQLPSLNVSGLTNLQYLYCSNNQIPSLNLSGFTNLQNLSCSNNQLPSLNVSGLTNLQSLNCSNNQLPSLNVSGLTNLQSLYCGNNQLPSLNVSGLTNLQSLYCGNNQLTSLNVSGLTNLQSLDCSGNQLPSLNVSGLTNLQSLNCSANQLPILDVSGLTNLQSFNCSANQLPILDVSGLTNLQYLDCSNNQLSSLNVAGLTNLLNLFCSNNQLPSLNVTSLTILSWLKCDNNQLSSLNVNGLTNLQDLNCSNNQLSSLNVSGLTNLGFLSCDNNQLTTLFMKAGNTNWYSLHFSQNPNLAFVCADEEDIVFVQSMIDFYSYTATCHVNDYCSFTPGGAFYTIQGNNKYDSNNNGCDALDYGFPNLKYSISNGSVLGSLISNATGNYSISVQAGTHTITPQLENPSYFIVSPNSANVTLPSATSPFTQNFCIAPNGVHHDLEIVIIPIGVARPGFDVVYKIKYKNKGNLNENATINLNYDDAILDYVSSSLSPSNQATGELSWNVGVLTPFQSGEIFVTLNVNSPTETPPVNGGDILSYTANISGLNADETPNDNTFILNQTVVNSYDPNDKMCLEGSTINPTMIGEYVHYRIRFENTGTYPAQNIIVKDMIDTTKFDVSTLQITDSSHNCITRVTNPNKVEFVFENINLPFDDANNDGYVVFKIKTKPTLVLGNTFSNTASIYFDYNFPIITNTATTTFSNALANQDFDFVDYFSISPNPAKDILTIQTKENIEVSSINVYNTLGQLVLLIPNAKDISTIDVSGLKTGNYFIKVLSDKGVSSIKFIKE